MILKYHTNLDIKQSIENKSIITRITKHKIKYKKYEEINFDFVGSL